jgi:pimeloyl-ACP methyl ester carboxylesterase
MLHLIVITVLTTFSAAVSSSGLQATGGGDLRRSAFFGAKVNPISDEVRSRLKLDAEGGIEIGEIIAGTSAAKAGLRAGDVLLAVDGAKILGPSEFVRKVSGLKAGASIAIKFCRGEVHRTETVTLAGRPFEKSDDYDVVYGSVSSHAGRLRTILTQPKSEGKHPALFLIQGIGLFSIDNPVASFSPYHVIIDKFTRRGFTTLRVDKPGCGDSEGGPAEDVDFETELDGYRQALRKLREQSNVDANRVFIFGHSMGGVMAPLLGVETPVRGILVYGTIARTWTEYMLENTRRQMELANADPSAIDRDLKSDAALLTHLYLEKLTPEEIGRKYPHLRERLRQTITKDRYFVDRSLTFFRQLAEKNLGATWERFDGRALAIWGKADFLSNQDDHALIVRIINRSHPGHGTMLTMDGIDHGFYRADSQRESFVRAQSREPRDFNSAIIEVCLAWIDKTVGEPSAWAENIP